MGQSDLRIGAFEERGLSQSSLAAIRATPGVTVAAPVLEQQTYLQRDPLTTSDATAGAYGSPVTVIGIDPAIDGTAAGIHDLQLAAGQGLTSGGAAEALVPASMTWGWGSATRSRSWARMGRSRIGSSACWPAAGRTRRPRAGPS